MRLIQREPSIALVIGASFPVVRPMLFAGSLMLAAVSSVSAQWSVVNLHPPGSLGSQALGVHSGQQVGTADGVAALWFGSASSFVNLGTGAALGTDGVQQVGYKDMPIQKATLWSGSAATSIDLTPPGWIYPSIATSIGSGQQGGYLPHQLTTYAALWNGSAGSYVPLSGGGYLERVFGVDSGQQVGVSSDRACMWNSTGLFVSLAPAGASESRALGVHAGTQVGWFREFLTSAVHACVWHGTSASCVDLNPSAAYNAVAHAVFGAHQVGAATTGGSTHAVLWSGTAASMVDLHAFLPSGYTTSTATGIWSSPGGTIYVSGYARNLANHDEAVLWVRAGPSSTTFCPGDGSGTPCPCGNESPVGSNVGCLNSLGNGAGLSSSGSASVSADTFVLTGGGMPDTSVLYFQGTVQAAGGAGVAFGDGLRCAGGTVIRLGLETNMSGTSQYPGAGDLPISVRGGNVAGNLRTYQAWYRNPSAFCTPSTYNLTNGVQAIWDP